MFGFLKKSKLRTNCLLTRYPIVFANAKDPKLKLLIEVTSSHGYQIASLDTQSAKFENKFKKIHWVQLNEIQSLHQSQSLNELKSSTLIMTNQNFANQFEKEISSPKRSSMIQILLLSEQELQSEDAIKSKWLDHLMLLAEDDFINEDVL